MRRDPGLQTVSHIEEALRAHEVWLQTEGQRGSRAEFTNIDLSGRDLSGRNLSRAKFSLVLLNNANLPGTDLSGAQIFASTLKGADLRNAILTDTDFTWSSLKQADLRGAKISGNGLRMVNMSGAKVIAEDFQGIDLGLTPDKRLPKELRSAPQPQAEDEPQSFGARMLSRLSRGRRHER